MPVWTPDGTRVIFSSARTGAQWDLYWQPIRGGGDEPLFTGPVPPQKYVRDLTRDGRFLLFEGRGAQGSDLWVLPLTGDRKPYRLMESPFAETHGRVSPDGRWLAFTSNETGELHDYLSDPGRPMADLGCGRDGPSVARRWERAVLRLGR